MPDLAVDVPRGRTNAVRRVGIALFVALVVVPLVTVAVASTRLFTPGGRTLEVELLATGGRWAEIFWSDGFAMSAQDSALATLHQNPGHFETIRFPLPQKPLETLRFDPLDSAGEVVIRRMQVLDNRGRVVRTINPMVMLPLNQIAFMRPEADGVRVVTTPGANDPMLVARSSWLVETPRWSSILFVTPWSLAWIAGAVILLILTAFVFIAREVRAGPVTWRDGLWLASLVLVIVWAKLVIFERYQMLAPFWDQWDGEALTLYIPWADHGVTWRQMFTFHNEHRIFFSRLLALTELVVNGQWDPRLQITINAVLHSLAALVFAVMLWLAIGRRLLPVIVLAVVVAFAPPFAIENTLAGFQSAFYFLVLFSGLALCLVGRARPGSSAWLLGWFIALCCPFTVAGGVLILPALALVVLFRAIAESWTWRWSVASAAALATVGTIGYAGLPPPIATHAVLKADSVRHFAVALTRSLAFPWIDYPRAVVVMWLPFTIATVLVLRRRLQTSPMDRAVLGIGAWVAVQCAAMAYSRGADGAAPASRYLDMVALGYLANTMVLIGWLTTRSSRPMQIGAGVALASWIAITGFGVLRVSQEKMLLHGPERRHWGREHLRNLREFAITDNVSDFVRLRGPQEIPYSNASMLATWLEHPYIKRIMPAAVRAPLDARDVAAAPDGDRAEGGVTAAYPPPMYDSYSGNGRAGQSRFESTPMACTDLRHLRFEVASSADWSGLELSFVALASGEKTPVSRPWLSSGGWTSIVLRCPDGPFKVIAADTSATSWLAIRPPAEVALGSAWAEFVIDQSRFLALGAAAIAIAALVSSINAVRPSPLS